MPSSLPKEAFSSSQVQPVITVDMPPQHVAALSTRKKKALKAKARDSLPDRPEPSSSSSTSPPPVAKAPIGRGTVASSIGPDSWASDYAHSAWWGDKWMATQGVEAEWPKGIRLQAGILLQCNLVCVPESRVREVTVATHEGAGHLGVKKLVSELARRYAFPPAIRLFEEARGTEEVPCVPSLHPTKLVWGHPH